MNDKPRIGRLAQLFLALLIGAAVAAGCAGASEDATEPEEEREIFAGVNIAIADVALSEVVFDTFDGGSITLDEATEEQVLDLLNAIPPLDEPVYIDAADATYLRPDDLILGYVGEDGSAWAHPHRILNFHEIVNTTVADRPVAITYCPLCASGVVFDRRPNDLRHEGTLTFDNTSALYENDMVMVDAETNTYWWQVAGRGLVGNLTGSELVTLPSTTTSWQAWMATHPNTQVLSNDQGRGPRYERDPFTDYGTSVEAGRVPFPVSPDVFDDARLSPSTRIIGFEVGGRSVAVPVVGSSPSVVLVDVLDAGGVVVLLDGLGGGSVFEAPGAIPLNVTDSGFVDADEVVWDAAGRSTTGDQLTPVPSTTAFWFAWVAVTSGDTRVVGPDGEIS
ncbi:MAG: DUF3179 domain-containing protein [Actinomycetota bacterium]